MKIKFLIAFCLIAITANAQKRISILGDSYSTYQGYITPATNEPWYFEPYDSTQTDVNNVQQTWWWQVCKRGGNKLEVNNSYSGATICYTGYNGDDYSPRSFITRAANLGSPDIILVFGGTNDSWADSPIGEMKWKEWTAEDLKAYRPAICYLGQYLYNRYPNTDIYFMLNTELKPEIGEAMKEMCSRFGFKMITLANIDKKNGHPNAKGMTSIANQVLRAIRPAREMIDRGRFTRGEERGNHRMMQSRQDIQ